MKRALWITVIAMALVLLAAVGIVVRAFQRATSGREPRSRPLSSALAR